MRKLSFTEIECVAGRGSGIWDQMSDAMAAVSAASAALALVPSPASLPLGVFSGVTGLMSAGASYMGHVAQ